MITELDYKKFEEFFYNYFKTINVTNKTRQKIQIKINHTEKVIQVGEELARRLDLDINLAKTICLFHDIGRFSQIEKYNTFRDSESEDHSELGIDLLNNSNILDKFEEKELIITAINYHNKVVYDVPEFKDKKIQTYVNFIRDADKIDIFRTVYEFDLFKELDFTYSKKVVNDFFEKKQISYEDIASKLDHLILDLGWIYDINFKESFDILREQGFVEKLAELLPDSLNEIKEKIFDRLGLNLVS